jgi:H+/Cl- antiporter ClcA
MILVLGLLIASPYRTPAQWSISNSLLLATIIRIGLVVITYGCKVPAGIFVPSMAIGATFGRMIGIMVKAMYRWKPLRNQSPKFSLTSIV